MGVFFRNRDALGKAVAEKGPEGGQRFRIPASLWQKKRGSVLVITMLILMSIAGLTLDLTDETALSLTLSGYSRDQYLAREAARSGTHYALELLASDTDKEADSLQETWAKNPFPISQGNDAEQPTFSGRITDESGKLNVNRLLNAKGEIDENSSSRLTRLFGILGLGEEKAAPVLDWLDKDDIERMHGAESHYYQSLKEPYTCGNGPFLTPVQIYLVKGIQESAMKSSAPGRRILDYITTYSDGKININTASPEVLRSLSEKIDASIAQSIASYRETQLFRKPEDLKKVPGVTDDVYSGVSGWVSVASSAFLIETEGACSGVTSAARAVAVRSNKGVKFVYWKVQ